MGDADKQDFMARRTKIDRGTKFLSRTVVAAPFNIGGVGFHFDALLLVRTTSDFGTNVLAQPDLLIDLVPSRRLQLGTRIEYARYNLPTGGTYERTSPYLLLKFVL
eukprot:TRINITY_DN20523_c0_g1_i4.p4 TRINITY_DN20523_c0_g1~~TRINITY_DN20523_c0_g1_i4.p4  ORF type:complete len:106 (+),score=26.92 TRINITY_DN20523_c0_g1_i4:528-845(+)